MSLAVVEVGPPQAPAAVVAHGVGSTARFVREAFAAPLNAAGLRLVSYDLRGHGGSTPLADPAEHRLQAHVADLAAVVASCDARLVGGVSLGAHAALELAAEDATIGGVLACLPAWIGRAPRGRGAHAAVAAEITAVGVAGALRRIRDDPALPPWLRTLLLRDLSVHDPDSLAAALVALDGGDAPDLATLGAVGAPVGVVAWPGDAGHPVEVARRWVDTTAAASLVLTSLDEVGRSRAALGAAALRALVAAGWRGPRGR